MSREWAAAYTKADELEKVALYAAIHAEEAQRTATLAGIAARRARAKVGRIKAELEGVQCPK